MSKMFIQILIILLVFFTFLCFYLIYYEKKCIYFPTKNIDVTPADIGLQYEDVYFVTVDNVKLHGWFIPATNPKATLIYCHGNAGNIGHRLGIIEIFNKLNLNIFIFDYRGYGKSGGIPSRGPTSFIISVIM